MERGGRARMMADHIMNCTSWMSAEDILNRNVFHVLQPMGGSQPTPLLIAKQLLRRETTTIVFTQ